jgi:hypothetical protein
VDPLAFSVFFPPQLTFTGGAPVDALPVDALGALALLSLPHPDSANAMVARTHGKALNRSSFKFCSFVYFFELDLNCAGRDGLVGDAAG